MVKPIISGAQRTFRRLNPDESYLEFEGSTIMIPMRGRRSENEPWMEEELKLKAFMRLEIFPPYVNNLGTREFQFLIRDWDLYGKSEMLNRLFFDHPLGQFHPETNTYVPAIITFTVSHNYSVEGDDHREIFGHEKYLEIRNLTSHHLRTYDSDGIYSPPNNRIYWQVIDPETVDNKRLIATSPQVPVVVFHKKRPIDAVRNIATAFDINKPEDVSQYLLGVANFSDSIRAGSNDLIEGSRNQFKTRMRFQESDIETNLSQLRGNTVISPQYQPRSPLEFRWRLNSQFRQIDQLKNFIGRQGSIKIVSPARSLGTADQAPDVGHPIDSADFPARISYAINYDISINREKFVEDQAGIAIAVGADQVPPRDVVVAFEKPHVGPVLQKILDFKAGWCTGMQEISEKEYLDGLNFARYARTAPLDPNSLTSFRSYDPNKEY